MDTAGRVPVKWPLIPLPPALYLALQAGTVLIQVLAANTSFADFPRLASFHAGVRPGARIRVDRVLPGSHPEKLALLKPEYTLIES